MFTICHSSKPPFSRNKTNITLRALFNMRTLLNNEYIVKIELHFVTLFISFSRNVFEIICWFSFVYTIILTIDR